MNICIFTLLSDKYLKAQEHLGVNYIISYLRSVGYNVIHRQINQNQDNSIVDDINAWKPFLVLISLHYMPSSRLTKIADFVKQSFPSLFIAVGGPATTFNDKQILERIPSIDFVIRGEGEVVTAQLAKACEYNSSFTDVRSISWRNRNEIVQNPFAKAINDLDSLPFPTREDEITDINHRTFRISSARGCVGNCSFCVVSSLRKCGGQGIWRGRSVVNVVDEIEDIVLKFQSNKPIMFEFIDPTFDDPGEYGKLRIRNIAEEIIKRKLLIRYTVFTRAENWIECDNDIKLLKLLVESGLEGVFVGTESGNANDMKIYNKISTTENNNSIMELMKKLNIYVIHGFIMFNPYSTFNSLMENIAFLKRQKIDDILNYFISILHVYKGTSIYEKLNEDKLLISDQYIDQDGIFDYMGMYEYMFADKRVETAAKSMYLLFAKYNDTIAKYEGGYFKYSKFVMKVKRDCSKILELPKINNIINEIERLRIETGTLNINNFEHLLRYAKNYNAIPEEFIDEWGREYTNIYNSISKMQLKLIYNINKHVAHLL